jgi:hypothetical protein
MHVHRSNSATFGTAPLVNFVQMLSNKINWKLVGGSHYKSVLVAFVVAEAQSALFSTSENR